MKRNLENEIGFQRAQALKAQEDLDATQAQLDAIRANPNPGTKRPQAGAVPQTKPQVSAQPKGSRGRGNHPRGGRGGGGQGPNDQDLQDQPPFRLPQRQPDKEELDPKDP